MVHYTVRFDFGQKLFLLSYHMLHIGNVFINEFCNVWDSLLFDNKSCVRLWIFPKKLHKIVDYCHIAYIYTVNLSFKQIKKLATFNQKKWCLTRFSTEKDMLGKTSGACVVLYASKLV